MNTTVNPKAPNSPTETVQKLCSSCAFQMERSSRKYTTLFDFPYKGFTVKGEMTLELQEFINTSKGVEDKEHTILFEQKQDKYRNTILHELVYLIGCKTYSEKQYRKQYVWAVEILSGYKEFERLCRTRNAKGETPIYIHIMLSEDHESNEYHIIKEMLEKHSEEEIILSGHDDRTVSQDTTQSETATGDSSLNRIFEPDRPASNPEVRRLTAEYHRIQDKLFRSFQRLVPQCITHCSKCDIPVDIFSDFDAIGRELCSSQDLITLGFIRHNLNLLLQSRRKCIQISEQNAITKRHKHIADIFERLYRTIDDSITAKRIQEQELKDTVTVKSVDRADINPVPVIASTSTKEGIYRPPSLKELQSSAKRPGSSGAKQYFNSKPVTVSKQPRHTNIVKHASPKERK